MSVITLHYRYRVTAPTHFLIRIQNGRPLSHAAVTLAPSLSGNPGLFATPDRMPF